MGEWNKHRNKIRLDVELVRRAALWGLLAFVLAICLLLPVSLNQYRRNEADLAASTQVQAVETAVRLQQEIDHHLKLLEVLRDKLERRADFGMENVMAEAAVMTSAWPAFQAINWISPDGDMLAVMPEEDNRLASRMNVLDVPAAAPAFRLALESGALAATPPLALRQGGRGVTTYVPVHAQGEVRGVINGVFRLGPLFGGLLTGDLLKRYAIRVMDEDRVVYAAGEIPARFEGSPAVTVAFDQRLWQLQLAPRAERVADFAAQFRVEAALIFGIALLAGLLAGLLGYKQMWLRHTERRFRELNRLLPDMVLECDERWQVTYLNALAQRQLGYVDGEVRDGLALNELLNMEDMEAAFDCLRTETTGQPITRICAVRRHDGEMISCEITLGAIQDEGGQFRGARAVLRDITERLDAERTMNRLANFDPTTQLPNRGMFLQVLNHEIRQAEAQNRRLVLMVIDLDNFKSINDRLGPSIGDLLLREAGQRLRDALNREGNVFRTSGDEFAVLFDNIDSREEMERTAQFLLTTLRQPYHLRANAGEIINATIGVSVFPEDATDSEQLYMHADVAVCEAKLEGGRRFRLYTREISRQVSERTELEEALRHALQRNELKLMYQPVVNAASGSVIGVEALLRWQHPQKGLLAPFHFIRLAEETGLIDAIGAWVLQEACQQMTDWDRIGIEVPQLAVNVSAHQLESGALGNDVRRALGTSGLPGERLVLELTESLLMRDVHFAARMLAGLKSHGVRTAVDDFGTGYSSLAYLNRLPIDTLKIDRAFIAPVAEPGGDTRVTEAVIALGRLLKLHIVAEGVEHAAQADFLVEHGCVAMQGYYFSRPVPPDDIPALIAKDWRSMVVQRRASMRV
ncbi:MAG TPA: EAL domain-containing protein [Gammaproteobacteria bacterium]